MREAVNGTARRPVRRLRLRRAQPLTIPVLTLAGDRSLGPRVGEIGQIIAVDPVNVVIENCGHYLPEEQPEALLDYLLPFLGLYRAG